MKYSILFITLTFLASCSNKPTADKGSINIKTKVYYNASKGLQDAEVFVISKMQFYNDRFMEYVPSLDDPRVIDSIFLIKGDKYHKMLAMNEREVNDYDFENIDFDSSLEDKISGAMWIKEKDTIDGYSKRMELNDTIWNGIDYSRFSISADEHLTLFWIEKNDTLLPYSLNRIVDDQYKGRMTRIDTYDKTRDLFSTVVMEYDRAVDKAVIDKLKKIK